MEASTAVDQPNISIAVIMNIGKETTNLDAYFGNMNCTWARTCQFGPSSGATTL